MPALEVKDLRLEKVRDERLRESLAASTPLWYVIVGEVLSGLIETDPHSFLREEPDWQPGILGGKGGDFSMASLVRFARGEDPL